MITIAKITKLDNNRKNDNDQEQASTSYTSFQNVSQKINNIPVQSTPQQNNSDDDLESALISLLSKKKNKKGGLKDALKSLLSNNPKKNNNQDSTG